MKTIRVLLSNWTAARAGEDGGIVPEMSMAFASGLDLLAGTNITKRGSFQFPIRIEHML